MSEEIVIDIDNLRARKILENQNNHFFITRYATQINDLIKRRIQELSKNNGAIQDYFEYKMHDSILIYGTRGNGKTTIMMNLKEMLFKDNEFNKKIKIMEIIDPTLLEEEEDFLLVILKNIYAEVLNYQTQNFDDYNKNFEQQLESILEQIEGTRVKGENKIEIFDKFYGNKSGVSLVKTIHKLFYTVTKIFNVKAIILPLDDIDMNMVQGYRITETIRKYLSSPYIIPIVSFNLKQMNAIAKKNKYGAFGLHLLDREKEGNVDLDFLRSLPSDYLASIFPPNRRIFLKSLFYILKEELATQNIFLQSHKITTLQHIKDKIEKNPSQINLITILRLFLELVYEKRLPKKFKTSDLDEINDYLTCRSIRDFFNDISATIHSLTEDKEDYLTFSKAHLLTRFSPENQNIFSSKKQALISLWYDFLEIAKKNLNKKDLTNQEIQNNWANVITDVAYDDYAELAHKKTYRRLWLQGFYTKEHPEIFMQQSTKNSQENFHFLVKKKSSLAGFLELALRSYIPMFLFEMIISRHQNLYSMYDIMKLRDMATSSLIDVAYYLSIMELHLKQYDSENEEKLREDAKVFASIHVNVRHPKLHDPEFNIPYLFKLRKQDLFFNNNNNDASQIYFFSIFKGIALFIESLKIIETHQNDKEKLDNAYRRLFERYRVNLPCEHNESFVQDYHKKLILESNAYIRQLENIQNFNLENSEFGIQTCMEFSKRLIAFFYEIRSNINLNDNFSSLNFKENPFKINKQTHYIEGTRSEYAHFPLSTYLSGFSQALLISLINTQEDAEEFNIYTINSIHGANLFLLKKYPQTKNGKHKLSKSSNKFLSNINYLLPEEEHNYKNLEAIADTLYKRNKFNIKSKNLDNILALYDNFLGLDYFFNLMKNYKNIKESERCSPRKKPNAS